ncbi:MAG: phage replication initiation protein, NGO0469 family [Pseudomonadota bacterium]
MALIASDTGGGDFRPVPQGVHTGRCVRVIDLGTQPREFQGKPKPPARKVSLTWELHGEDEDGTPLTTDDGKPLIISKRYTLSLGEKSILRADLESWRGRAFTSEELAGFDVSKLLGAPALINVKHEARDFKTYSNVASISPVPKAMRDSVPAAVSALQLFDVTAPDMTLFEAFGEKLQETIRACAEWQKKPTVNQAAAASAPSRSGMGTMDDDIPW